MRRPHTIAQPFPFNTFYAEKDASDVTADDFELEIAGRVQKKNPWTLEQLYALPQVSQITRHVCIEGWSAIGQWSGVRLSHFLQLIGAGLTARYVGYSTSIDMPMKLRMPTKLGYENPKHITEIVVTNENRGGFWEK